jgi:hypothetical protein
MKKRGRPSIYGPMMKPLKVDEYVSFDDPYKARACYDYCKTHGIPAKQQIDKITIRGREIVSHRVVRVRKQRSK